MSGKVTTRKLLYELHDSLCYNTVDHPEEAFWTKGIL